MLVLEKFNLVINNPESNGKQVKLKNLLRKVRQDLQERIYTTVIINTYYNNMGVQVTELTAAVQKQKGLKTANNNIMPSLPLR